MPYLTDWNFLIAQYLWQAQCQILLIILLKKLTKFIKLNVTMDSITKTVRHLELNTEMVPALFEYTTVKDDLIK